MVKTISAFSLIEMAIVLIIIGLISGLTLPTLKNLIENQKIRTTHANQEKIMYALASYANQYKFLPCAADPNPSNGKEDRATHRRRGIVPYADLGLPESIAKDGYQRWFTYVVNDFYTDLPQNLTSANASYRSHSRLCDILRPPNPVMIKGQQNSITVAIISHGPEGRGAYPLSTNAPPLGADEEQNSTSDTQLIDRPISIDPARPFSHKVLWVTAHNLLALYGHAPCPPPPDRLTQTGSIRVDAPPPPPMK